MMVVMLEEPSRGRLVTVLPGMAVGEIDSKDGHQSSLMAGESGRRSKGSHPKV